MFFQIHWINSAYRHNMGADSLFWQLYLTHGTGNVGFLQKAFLRIFFEIQVIVTALCDQTYLGDLPVESKHLSLYFSSICEHKNLLNRVLFSYLFQNAIWHCLNDTVCKYSWTKHVVYMFQQIYLWSFEGWVGRGELWLKSDGVIKVKN